MNTVQEKKVKKINVEKSTNDQSAYHAEQKGFSWQIIFVIAAFAFGSILFVLKIMGVL